MPPHLITSFMNIAINLGIQNLGQTMRNPSVGALVVREIEDEWRVVGQGITAPSGMPHAETQAIAQAGDLARGAVLFCSLEPCSDVGRTGPCAQAIIDAGIVAVYAACEDPNPRIFGKGFAMLRDAGIVVHTPLLEHRAIWANAGNVVRQNLARPFVRLSLAFSKEGCLTDKNKAPFKISNDISNGYVHRYRSLSDAVMVGSETVLHDNPQLTVRLNGYHKRQTARIVLDSRLRTPVTSNIAQQARDVRTVIFTSTKAEAAKMEALQGMGVEIIQMPFSTGQHIDLNSVFTRMADMGFTSIFLEGGAMLAQSCILEGLVDEAVMVSTQTTLSEGGYNPGLQRAIEKQISAQSYFISDHFTLDTDTWQIWHRKDHPCLPV